MRANPIAVLAIVASGVLALGCGPRREAFEPSEAATARSPQGYTAARYTLETTAGDFGEVKVWSQGAYRGDVEGEKRTIVHAGFEIENHSDVPIRLALETVTLDSATVDQRALEGFDPIAVRGDPQVPPDETGEVDVFFLMPRGVKPGEVDAFRLHWKLRDGELEYTQHTPFLEAPDRYAAAGYYGYYYSPFYDPFFYDPFYYPHSFILHRRPFHHRHRIVIR